MPNLKLWKDPLPNESIDGGKQLLERLRWNITINQTGEAWTVHAGHQLLLKTTSAEAVEALVYGMALSYSVIPDRIMREFQETVDRDTDGFPPG
jgi:hypothetical protein